MKQDEKIHAVETVQCKRHGSEIGMRCNTRTVACSYRVSFSKKCPACSAPAGHPCAPFSRSSSPAPMWGFHRQRTQPSQNGGA
jgi:hypothetical protein